MKIFNTIQWRSSGSVCRDCANFQNDPVHIEESYKGLTIMSSGFASVRDQDGFCNFHNLYLSSGDSCPQFSLRATETKELTGKD